MLPQRRNRPSVIKLSGRTMEVNGLPPKLPSTRVPPILKVRCSPTLDRRMLGLSGSAMATGWLRRRLSPQFGSRALQLRRATSSRTSRA